MPEAKKENFENVITRLDDVLEDLESTRRILLTTIMSNTPEGGRGRQEVMEGFSNTSKWLRAARRRMERGALGDDNWHVD